MFVTVRALERLDAVVPRQYMQAYLFVAAAATESLEARLSVTAAKTLSTSFSLFKLAELAEAV